MKRFFLLLCSMTTSLFAGGEVDSAKVLEVLKSDFKKHEAVFMVKDGKVRVFKDSLTHKAPTKAPKGIDLIVFERAPVRSKDGKSTVTRERTMRIIGSDVFCSSGVRGEVFKAPLTVVEDALEKLRASPQGGP